MAPEQSTQTEQQPPQTMPQTDPQAFSMPPAQPPPAQQHQFPQHQQQNLQGQYAGYNQYPASYGQPFQSYQNAPAAQSYQAQQQALQQGQQQGQQQQQQQVYQQQPERAPEKFAWGMTKDVLHGMVVVLSIAGLAVSLSLIGFDEASIAAVASGPIFVVALIWSGAELITRAVRKFKAGIHPGAHVGLCLILWLGGGIAGGLEAALASIDRGYYSSSCYNYDTQEYEDDCPGPFAGKLAQFSAAAALTCVVAVFEFVLFVGACVDTAKYNAHAKRPLMIVSGPPYWGPMTQGWQPMPQYYNAPGTQPQQQQQQQQQQYQPQNEQRQTLSVSEQGQSIPLQTRSPSPMMTPAGQEAPAVERNGKQPEEGQGLREFYTPGPRA